MKTNTSWNSFSLTTLFFHQPSIRKLSWFFILTTVLLCTLPFFAQNAPHPSYRQYTTDDGLASPETFHILQDQEGFIWIATDNGVSRFDGYEFRNFGLKEGLRENVIFMLQTDTLGRLWMQAMSGNLYYMEGQRIYPYRYNEVIQSMPDRPDYGRGFIVEGAGETVHISTLKYGLITIPADGSIITYDQPESVYHQVFEKNDLAIYAKFNNQGQGNKEFKTGVSKEQITVCPVYFYVNDTIWNFLGLDRSKRPNYNAEALRLGKGQYLFQVMNKVWYIENGEVKWENPDFPPKIQYARLMNKGQLYLGLYGHQGLRVYPALEAFRHNRGSNRLPEKTVNFFMEDRDGGRWFATHEDGVFYAAADAFMVYDLETGLPDEKVTAIAVKDDKELFAGLENGEVWKMETESDLWTKLPGITGRGSIKVLYFDRNNQLLWAARDQLVYLQKMDWNLNPFVGSGLSTIPANRISGRVGKEGFWVSNALGFLCVQWPQKITSNVLQEDDQRTFSVLEDFKGRVWAGQTKGLFEWKDSRLRERQSLHPAFALRVEDLALLADSTLVIATKGGGLVFWKNNTFEQITRANGLTADMLENVYADEKGNLWAGTLNGLNRISGDFGQRKVERITVSHGLPSNEINHIQTFNDNVWVATNKGLVYFSNIKSRHFSPKPVLASVLANDDTLNLNEPIELPIQKNNISIHFFAINYNMNGRIPYRFRMDKGDWQLTMNRTLNFPALPPGQRLFEVQAQNEDGLWSESATLHFAVKPPWWATWWAISLFITACISAISGIYIYRTQQLKHSHQIQLKMAELERSALQAQMHPHFIFNCLNSIQKYILQNEKDKAILYLGSFASLVRSILNASVSGKIPLAEEVKLLTNYLDLEKLRFKNRFEYEINTSGISDAFDIKIPPLLVQPYVENAVKHGISGRKKDGKVSVFFKEQQSFIKVTIEDNGGGIQPEKEQKQHKSFGMSITRNRLNLLSGKNNNDLVSTETLQDKTGKITGTRVVIRIHISKIGH